MAQARYTQQSLFDNVGLSPTRATNVRPTQFAGMQAAAQLETTRANVKNRLAKMLDPIATSYIENEALKYSAENPVTQKQLDDITGEGDVSDLEGNDFTVRGKILKKLRASQVSNQLLTQAKTEMLKMLPGIESGNLSYDKVLQQANEIIDGYTGTVGKLDPEVAIKFRASAASLGNTLYQKAINLNIQRNKALALVNLKKEIKQTGLIITEHLNLEFNSDGSTENPLHVNIETKLQALENNTIARITSDNQIDANQIVQLSEEAGLEFRNARINAVVDYVTGDKFSPNLKNYQKIEKLRKLDAGKHTSIFSKMIDEDRKKVINEVRTVYRQRREDFNSALEVSIKEKNDELENLIISFVENEGNPVEQQNIFKRMKNIKTIDGITVITAREVEKFKKNKGLSLQEKVDIETQIYRNEITKFSDLTETAIKLGATPNQMEKLYTLLKSEVKREEKEIEHLILGISPERYSSLRVNKRVDQIKLAERHLRSLEMFEKEKLKEKFNKLDFLNDVLEDIYDFDVRKIYDESTPGTGKLKKLEDVKKYKRLRNILTNPKPGSRQ
jgi:hypothetical protein